MKRRLVIAACAGLLVTGVGSAAIVADAASTSSSHTGRHGHAARHFVGYWMGIDPLDGGDSRRGITPNADRSFAMIGRDTVFTLCDGTDRAIVTMEGATVVGRHLVSDDFVIKCTNSGDTVRLKARYDVIDRGIIRETLTTQAGAPVDTIIFHRVSER